MLDIRGDELLIIMVIAVILIGPERLPEYVRTLKSMVKRGKALLTESKETLKSEFGNDIDWRQYDPRQYDPRKIVRDALAEPLDDVATRTPSAPAAPAAMTVAEQLARKASEAPVASSSPPSAHSPAVVSNNPATHIGAAYASEAMAGAVASSVRQGAASVVSADTAENATAQARRTEQATDLTQPLHVVMPDLPIAYDPEST